MRACILAVLGGWAVGCGGPPPEKYVEVAGRLTVGGKPVARGQVGFIPDEARGTTHPEYSIGEIASDGAYRLVTNSKGGVRPGWYKVVVWASAEPMSPTPAYDAHGQLAPIRWLVATKYTTRETTDLRVEVVEAPAPDAYNFDLSPP